MGVTTELATHVISSSPSIMADPIISGLVWFAGLVAAAFSIGVPVRSYLRRDKRESGVDQVADAMSGAGSVLYNHLSDQISQYRSIADQASKERNALVERVARLEERTEFLEETKQAFERLKVRLEEKDRKLEEKDEEIKHLLRVSAAERETLLGIIKAKDTEITNRDDRILTLDKRLRELELRLASDEAQTGTFICPFNNRPKQRISDVQPQGDSNDPISS